MDKNISYSLAREIGKVSKEALAISMVDAGFSIILLDPIENTPTDGISATSDKELILRLLKEHPDYNIGLPTGWVNNIICIDTEGVVGGDILANLLLEYKPKARPLEILKPNGGVCLIYISDRTYPTKTNIVGANRGLNILADGGYAILPSCDNGYQFKDYDIDTMRQFMECDENTNRLNEADEAIYKIFDYVLSGGEF